MVQHEANRHRRRVILGIQLSALVRFLGSSRFREYVIVGAIGVAALAALGRESQQRNFERLVAWDRRRAARDLRRAKSRRRKGR